MKKFKNYLITLVIGLIASLFIMFIKSVFHAEDNKEIMKILCDSFFVPGVLILCFGLLVVASNGGTFDMLTYGVIRFFSFFKKDATSKYKTFYDYRKAQQSSPRQFLYLVLVGLFYIIISLIFMVIYLNL